MNSDMCLQEVRSHDHVYTRKRYSHHVLVRSTESRAVRSRGSRRTSGRHGVCHCGPVINDRKRRSAIGKMLRRHVTHMTTSSSASSFAPSFTSGSNCGTDFDLFKSLAGVTRFRPDFDLLTQLSLACDCGSGWILLVETGEGSLVLPMVISASKSPVSITPCCFLVLTKPVSFI